MSKTTVPARRRRGRRFEIELEPGTYAQIPAWSSRSHSRDARNELFADEARAYARRMGLDMTTPLVLIARGGQVIDAWTGYRPDRILSLAV
ncbi:hypothetical protein [Cellulosimicrobium protaetiae]|uniref:Uncharacterized protein n=1 Tax=Cellulosimicrobium protaetiae TaxID=2587808 RepID=A0A6M5UMN0_9MICO|nr:hypothetical protein [Cellulosimicrobium protaetiae]QJW38099.1 hypothetical protein FIC82_019900 [Cellulosimicrobium protaetiae]